jgi:protein SCO1/2
MKRIVFLVGFSFACIFLIYFFNQPEEVKSLPVINPIDVNEEMVDPELLRIGYGHKVGAFSFLDQNNKRFTDKSINGKVVVAEYFFTSCGTICPKMNVQMKRVHKAFQKDRRFSILSFTVDPANDTPEQLKKYADSHDASDNSWHFLTGKKEDLYALARKSFFVLKPAEALNQGDVGSDFIHTNNFVLVDKFRRIRGYYDGTSPKEVDHLIEDIALLLEEK